MKPAPVVAGIVVGLAIGAAAVGGSLWATNSSSTTQRLRLDTYCRHRFGTESEGHVAPVGSGLQCSALEHGVWGLVAVEPIAVCKDQLGAQAAVIKNSAGGRACHR
jgi:hypothetical protein